jgi:DNA (cytosine-5)-methyltransferase 1
MPDLGNFGAVLQPVVGAIDCRINAQRAQNAAAGHLIPVAVQGNLIGRDAGGPCGRGASDSGTMYTLTENDVHAVAFQQNTRDEVRLLNGDGQIAGALAAEAGMKQQNYIAQPVPIQDGREIDKAQNGMGIGRQGDPAYTIDTTGAQAVAFTKSKRAQSTTDDETWVEGAVAPTMSLFDQGDVRATTAVVNMQGSKSNACVATDGSCFTLAEMHGHDVHAVAFQGGCQQDQILTSDAVVPTLAHSSNSHGGHHQPKVWLTDPLPPAVAHAMTVRRLTPVECERLQGFPDNYTLIPWRKKPAADCPDGPRYKALGNSMAVNCMEWIGERIAERL